MCRWIVYFSAEQILLDDVIRRPQLSILGQIDRHYLPGGVVQASDEYGSNNNFTNVDGFGVGWYSGVLAKYSLGEAEVTKSSGMQATVYRCDKPPKHDLNLASLCLTLESKCIMAHLRAGTPLSNTNNHPFCFGRYLVQHNGVIANFTKIQPRLLMLLSEDARAHIQGTTDSEHFAALFFTFLSPSSAHWNTRTTISHLLATLQRTISTVLSLIAEVGGYTFSSSGRPTSWCSLNLAITSGTQLLCTRFADPPEREPPSLYWSTTSGATLDRRFDGHPNGEREGARGGSLPRDTRPSHIVVASEPMTKGEDDKWHLMEPNSVISVEEEELGTGEGWQPEVRALMQ